jgi:ribosome assembly protein 1
MPELINASPAADFIDANIKDAMINFRRDPEAPKVAYVSKMVAIPESELPRYKRKGGSGMTPEEARELARKKRAEFAAAQAADHADVDDSIHGVSSAFSSTTLDDPRNGGEGADIKEDPEHLIGFARLYSGTLSVGDEVYVLPPKFTPANAQAAPIPPKVKVEALYLLMGRGLEALETVPAGVIFGIEGLAGHVLKSGTLCSTLEGGINLAGVNLGTQPIVRVALEPENPLDLDRMVSGLKMLEQSDPCAIYEVLDSGEHVLATAGELHLERCLKDLKERFARCDIGVGKPIVPYRESIVKQTEMSAPRDKELGRGAVVAETSSKQVNIRTRVRPLPKEVTEFLTRNSGAVKRLYAERRAKEEKNRTRTDPAHNEASDAASVEEANVLETGKTLSLEEFKTQLKAAFAEAKGEAHIWKDVVEQIATFGPRRVGPNLLIDATQGGTCGRL